MTGKLVPQTPAKQFPDFPPRDDMNNPLYLYRPGYLTTLHRHFGSLDTTLVISETPLAWRHSQQVGLLIPDLLVAFDVDPDTVITQRGYAIEEQGKAPDFVLEVASESTGRHDEGRKRRGYQDYKVSEYWRFDPSGGEYHRQHLGGDRLVDGVYQPIDIIQTDEQHYWGHSTALNLDVCWENMQLRWYDPITRRYLRTHDEEAAERAAERRGRLAAEARADSAEARADSAEARVRELENELQRRQDP